MLGWVLFAAGLSAGCASMAYFIIQVENDNPERGIPFLFAGVPLIMVSVIVGMPVAMGVHF